MNNKAKSYVNNENETWSSLKCGNCHNELDNFHADTLFDDKYCKFCKVEILISDWQIERDKFIQSLKHFDI